MEYPYIVLLIQIE